MRATSVIMWAWPLLGMAQLSSFEGSVEAGDLGALATNYGSQLSATGPAAGGGAGVAVATSLLPALYLLVKTKISADQISNRLKKTVAFPTSGDLFSDHTTTHPYPEALLQDMGKLDKAWHRQALSSLPIN